VQVRTLNPLACRLCGRRSTIEEVDVRRMLGNLVKFPKRSELRPPGAVAQGARRVRLGLADPETVEDELPDVSDL